MCYSSPSVLLQIQRDGIHSAGSYRGIQAPGHHAQGGLLHQGPQAEGPRHFRLGDPGTASQGRCLWQVQRAECFLNLQVRWSNSLVTTSPLAVDNWIPTKTRKLTNFFVCDLHNTCLYIQICMYISCTSSEETRTPTHQNVRQRHFHCITLDINKLWC